MENQKTQSILNNGLVTYLKSANDVEPFLRGYMGLTSNRLRPLIFNDLKTVENQHLKNKYVDVLSRFCFRFKKIQKMTIEGITFEKRLSELINCFPGLQYLLTVDIEAYPSVTILQNLYVLISGLIRKLVKHESINCLALDVSIIENSTYVGITHDEIGIQFDQFNSPKTSGMFSCGIYSIILDTGSITIESC
jgi:hypothetical protein